MKKLTAFLLIIAIAAVCWSVWQLQEGDAWRTAPWTKKVPLQNLSKAKEASNGSVAVILQSKQEIGSISASGKLEARIVRSAADGSRRVFTEVAVDGTGRFYVVDTVLDEYGLYVQKEEIVRYTRDGKHAEVLFEWMGDGQSMRVGQLRGLQVAGDSVYFYIAGPDKVSLMRQPIQNGSVKEIFSFHLPTNRYLSEITGTEPGEIYYSTKRGLIYRVDRDGSSSMIYPLDSMERTSKNFPINLSLDRDGNLNLVDQLLNAVQVMDPDRPGEGLRDRLTGETVAAAASDAESQEIVDAFVSADGSLVVLLNDRLLRFDGSGRLISAYAEAEMVRVQIQQAWLRWAALIAGVLLLAVSLRLVFVHWLQRRFSLFLKIVIVTVPLIAGSMMLLSNFIAESFSARLESEMQRELSLLARNGKNLIDGDLLNRMDSPADYRNADYEQIRANLNFLFEGEDAANRQGLYNTLYKLEDGMLYLIMDDDDGVNMFKPFEITGDNREVLENGVVKSGSWNDGNGEWMYAIGPVYDSNDRIVGIYETGRDMRVIEDANRTIYNNVIQNIILITSVLIVVILVATFLLLSNVRKLRRSVIEMADGNWNAEVRIRSRDEVGDLGEQFNRMARYIRQYIGEITRFSEASYRFVPQQVFQSLGKKGILDIQLGDQVQRNMTVMVVNLRGFNQLSQQLTPAENFNFMNSFLSRFGPLVRQEEGIISKYLGAGFMALYPGYAEQALRTAVAIRRELVRYNEDRRSAGYPPVDVGIAIHHGPLMMGIIGEEQRWEGNVISEDVQLTSVLEKLSGQLGATILVTQQFFAQLREPERFRHRSLGRISPEGQEDSVELIDVFEGDPDLLRQAKERTKELFERGLMLCQEGRFYDARETFVEVIKLNRFDQAAKLYFYLCDEYYQKGTSAGWNGTLAV
jgi:class 3 adenylate cyclase/HAMP domain-containing protein